MQKKRDLVEIFGYSPDDLSRTARSLWNLGACPFTNRPCIKINHDQTIVYGTCSVTSAYGDVIICPNRLYAGNYEVLKNVSNDAFGSQFPLLTYSEFVEQRESNLDCVVALGKNSGKEVNVGGALSMDWVLAHISNGQLKEYIGIEVQSIDITGNYRDAWHSYKNYRNGVFRDTLPSSQHGLNWANVHKRLIPQLIRKGVVYSRSAFVKKGLYFVLPEIVYLKFEDIIGGDIPLVSSASSNTITVITYELGPNVLSGAQRVLQRKRVLRFSLDEFSSRFVSGPNLPSGDVLDSVILRALGVL